jgi:hypothetical protein
VHLGKPAGALLSALFSGLGVNGFVSGFANPDGCGKRYNFQQLLQILVRYVIITVFTVQSFNILHLQALNGLGTVIVAYLPEIPEQTKPYKERQAG